MATPSSPGSPESTGSFLSVVRAARLATLQAGLTWESTQPFPSSELAARLAELQGGQQPPTRPDAGQDDAGQSEESTQLLPSVSEQQDFFTAPEAFAPASASSVDCDVDPGEGPDASAQLADVSLDQLVLRWDPRIRVVFKQPRGLPLQINQAGQQAITISSRPGGSSEQPFCVDLVGCIQSKSEPMFSLTAGGIQCNFFYVPNCDDIVLHNCGSPVEVQCVSQSEFSSQLPTKGCATLRPGTWKVWTSQHGLEFQLWPRQYSVDIEEGRVLGKRSSGQSTLPASKRRHAPGPDRRLSMPAMIPLSSSVEGKTACVAYCLDDEEAWFAYKPREGQTLRVRDEDADEPGYRLAYLHSRWERQSQSAYTFKAILNSDLVCRKAVVVKILTRSQKMLAQDEEARRPEIMSAAQRWYAEFKQHRRLNHPQIARLLAYDARIYSLYIEFKDLPDLGSSVWCESGSFKGKHADAYRILADISSALLYLEDEGILHNDIKPGNILYGRDLAISRRGAILIDFGLAQEEAGSMIVGGTPWYVPPEFREGLRGYPADVWALGISMLYLMKHIKLPEKLPRYPPWRLDQCRTDPAWNQMSRWIEWVGDIRSNLQASALQNNRKGCELDLYISKMLETDADKRITRRELAQQTRKWTSEMVAAEG